MKNTFYYPLKLESNQLIKISALQKDLLIFSDKASSIVSPSRKIVKTRGTVHLSSGSAVYYFHVLDEKHLPTVDGIIRREEYIATSTCESEAGFYGSPYGPPQNAPRNHFDEYRHTIGLIRQQMPLHNNVQPPHHSHHEYGYESSANYPLSGNQFSTDSKEQKQYKDDNHPDKHSQDYPQNPPPGSNNMYNRAT